MRSHRAFTYDRLARIRRRLLALRYAPTVAEQLNELRPVASGIHVNRGREVAASARMTHRS